MSRSAAYCVLIRDGEQRWFADVWGTLRRELVWGPEALESWLTAGEEIDWDPEDVCGAAIVDFDTKTLLWGEQDVISPPRAFSLHRKLIENSWPGFSIENLPSSELDTELYALQGDAEQGDLEDEEAERWEERPSTVQEAAEYFYPNEDEDLDDEDDEYEAEMPFSDGSSGAWLSIVDQDGKVRQRGLSAVSVDLLSGAESAVQEISELDPLELPEEKYVTEGLWLNLGEQQIRYWGPDSESTVQRLKAGWPTWDVAIAESGYAQQCEVAGLPGKPMSDAEALGQLLPQLISNKRMTMANLLGAMGGSLKKTAIKATGCLVLLLSLPILLIGFFMDMWREAGYALLTLVVVVVAAFKFIEFKLKSRFRQSEFAEKDDALEEQRPPVAGPLDETQRKERIGEMLAGCGLPTIAEIEPHFEDFEGIL